MNEYSRIDDEVYSINGYTKLICHTTLTRIIDNNPKSFYAEYKTNSRKECSVVIKRKIEYFLTLEYSYQGLKESVMLVPSIMYEVVEKINYIINVWFDPNNREAFGFLNDQMIITNQTIHCDIYCPQDKKIRIAPYIIQTENIKSKPAVVLYLGDTSFPIIMTKDKLLGLLWTLTNTNWLNFANTSLSFIGKPDGAYNRVDFSEERNTTENNFVNNDTIGRPRDFKFKQKSFFDK